MKLSIAADLDITDMNMVNKKSPINWDGQMKLSIAADMNITGMNMVNKRSPIDRYSNWY